MNHVLLFGSSLNPMTLAHCAILDKLSTTYPHAELRIVPTYIHPDAKNLAPYSARVSMTLEVINNRQKQGMLTNVTLSQAEEAMCHAKDVVAKEGVRTYELLNYFIAQEKKSQFSFILGGDTLTALLAGHWAKGDEVIRLCHSLIYINRAGFDLNELKSTSNDKNKRLAIQKALDKYYNKFQSVAVFSSQDMHLKNSSSTDFRELRTDQESLLSLVPVEVLRYCYTHGLYAFAADFCTKATVRNWYCTKNKKSTVTPADEEQISAEIQRRKTAQAKAIAQAQGNYLPPGINLGERTDLSTG